MASAATEPVLIVDTGVLVATADITDPHHTACLDLLADEPEPLVTTAMVIAETAYLLDRDLGPQAAARFYDSITSGQMSVEALTIEDWQRVHDLVVQYADLRLGGTDAGLIALAERHHTQRIATLTKTRVSMLNGSGGWAGIMSYARGRRPQA